MVFYNSNILKELQELSLSDKERIMQGLHWAIAEKLKKTLIRLHEFRSGEELCISDYEYSELYNELMR